MRRRPEGRAHVGRRLAGELLDVLLELPLLVAPGVVRVGLLEADLAERVHHRRPGERLGQPDHLGVVDGHVGDQPLPELHRLGVRVVDAEDLDPVVDPHLHDPAHLGVGALGVVVEVERVDVLVLLGRVLGVGDRAVGAGREPARGATVTQGWSGAACRARSRATSRPSRCASATNRSKSSKSPRSGWIASWPPSAEPMAYGEPGSCSPASRVLLGPLRLTRPIGWTGVQVDDVEAHVGDGRQPLRRGVERPGGPQPGLRVVGSRPRSGGRSRTRRRTGRARARPARRGCGWR